MPCMGVCHRYSKYIKGFKYGNGFKSCKICCCFFETEQLRCPCCHTILRTRSRYSRSKQYRINQERKKQKELICHSNS